MPTFMLGPADMTIAYERYHDALALAARMRSMKRTQRHRAIPASLRGAPWYGQANG